MRRKILIIFTTLFILITPFLNSSVVEAAKIYGANEVWKVDKNWELRVLGAQNHTECYQATGGKQVVLITYQYKNLGSSYIGSGLHFYPVEVRDEFGNVAEEYIGCSHTTLTHFLQPKGTTCATTLAYVLPKKSKSVTIDFWSYDHLGNDQNATFKVNVINNAPKYQWNTKREIPATSIDYRAGQTWNIVGVGQVKVNSAAKHYKCLESEFTGEQVILLNYSYINKGYGDHDGGLTIYPTEVYDEFGNAGFLQPCIHAKYPNDGLTINGSKADVTIAYILPKTSKYIYVDFIVFDKNMNVFTSTFVVPVGNKNASVPQPKRLAQPKLVAIYNSAHGADIRFKEVSGATHYTIYRKENGHWLIIDYVKASDLKKEGGNFKYIDEFVKDDYGKGYIYSVSASNEKNDEHSPYDALGLPLYRLKQPTIKSITNKGNGKVEVKWSKENCQGYEVQYSVDNGKTWSKAPQIKSGNTTSQIISGLKVNKKYAFRIRCQKTNKDRGTTWSQYSPWKSITVR